MRRNCVGKRRPGCRPLQATTFLSVFSVSHWCELLVAGPQSITTRSSRSSKPRSLTRSYQTSCGRGAPVLLSSSILRRGNQEEAAVRPRGGAGPSPRRRLRIAPCCAAVQCKTRQGGDEAAGASLRRPPAHACDTFHIRIVSVVGSSDTFPDPSLLVAAGQSARLGVVRSWPFRVGALPGSRETEVAGAAWWA